jgi:hypothetical protein
VLIPPALRSPTDGTYSKLLHFIALWLLSTHCPIDCLFNAYSLLTNAVPVRIFFSTYSLPIQCLSFRDHDC